MCGITGFYDGLGNSSQDILNEMVSTLKHRGPDDRGSEIHKNSNGVIGFGQTRLAIIDLSPLGHQPMHFENLSMVFNGEIYNYLELKKELEAKGHLFKSSSDTEVILHAFKEWGTDCVSRFIGMFSFVIYDNLTEKIYAFRDRAGVKPFYYYLNEKLFLFGSELKSFHKHPKFVNTIDERALKCYFDYGYVPSPYSIFKKTHKLKPGHFLIFDTNNGDLKTEEYWNSNDFYRLPKLKLNYEEAKSELHTLLKSAFKYRMIADVPIGIFLSGGYDSTSVAAILQHDNTQRLKTFTIGFEEGNNEAPEARDTARFLGTDHNEYICTIKEAQDIIPTLPYYYDEPFADSSAIPTMLVSRFARESVTVALSADAGDELFAGYQSYIKLQKYLDGLNRIPGFLKPLSSVIFSAVSKLTPNSKPALKHKLQTVSDSINPIILQQAANLFKYSNRLPSYYVSNLFLKGNKKYKTDFDIDFYGFSNEVEVAMAVDYKSYLENDILTKVDRATMSVSLEGRDPLVDHRLLEFAARLPIEYKYDGVTTKRILKDIVHEYVPREMLDRPKSGFSLPINSWLRGDLSWLLDEYLNEKRLSTSGFFRVPFLLKQIQLFKENKLHYSPLIWKLLMFQMWYDEWM